MLDGRAAGEPGRRAAGRLARRSGAYAESARSAASRASARPARRGEVVYVGDGYSDRCARARGRPGLRDGAALARYLDEQGVAYEPFDDFRVRTRGWPARASRSRTTSSSRPSASARSGPTSRTSGTRAALHRVVGGREVRIERGARRRRRRAARRRDRAGRADAARRAVRPRRRSTPGPQDDPVAAAARRAARRLPAAARARSVRDARHLDHGAAGLALRGVRDPQPADRALRRRVEPGVRVPDRERLARREPRRARRARLLAPQGRVRARPRAEPTSTCDELAALPDDEVKQRLVAIRGIGEWTADWFLARHLARPRAWPVGDLGLRKAVAAFYPDVPMLRRGRASASSRSRTCPRTTCSPGLRVAAR